MRLIIRIMHHFHYKEVTTTQDIAFSVFTENLDEGDTRPVIITSDKMTNGRGRIGRKWVANEEGNLNMSLCFSHLLFPIITGLPIVIATTIGEVLGLTDLSNFKYKWPNDLLLNNKKAGGVLIEIKNNIFTIGIGINIKHAPLVGDVETISLMEATALDFIDQHICEQHSPNLAQTMARAIAEKVLINLEDIAKNPNNIINYTNIWGLKSWKVNGDLITVKMPNHTKEGFIFRGIDSSGTMKAEKLDQNNRPNGEIINLSYGDVS